MLPLHQPRHLPKRRKSRDTSELISRQRMYTAGTYCGPCIGEMPDLQNWYTVEQSKDSGVMIVGIPYDVDASTVDEAIDILRDQGVTYPNLLVDDGLYEMFIKDITVVPTTYIVDSNGNIVAGPIEGAYIDFYHDEVLAYLDE